MVTMEVVSLATLTICFKTKNTLRSKFNRSLWLTFGSDYSENDKASPGKI